MLAFFQQDPAAIAPIYAFGQSDFFGKLIVLLLVAISIYVWTIMIDKLISLKKARRDNMKFFNEFRNSPTLFTQAVRQPIQCPLKEVYTAGLHKLMYLCGADESLAERYCREGRLPRPLTPVETEIVIDATDHQVATEGLKLEERIGNLATIVSVSPFFGLLGTVWGVMTAFSDMAMQNSANISTLAPGVSGSLLTTIVGLIVAIPSLIGYNFLTNTIRTINVDMDNFINEFEARLKLEVSNLSNGRR